MDLAPGRSFIEWAVQHGRTVFAISYSNPSADMSGTTMDDYLVHGPQTALDVIEEITGAETIDIVGLCLGGALTAITAAYLTAGRRHPDRHADPAQHDARLRRAGRAGHVHRPGHGGEAGEEDAPRRARCRAQSMAGTFDILRANDLIFNYVVSNWLMGQKPPAFDILAWNADSTRMPAAMHAFYLRNFYVENKLATGSWRSPARTIDLERDQGADLHRQRDQRPHRAVGGGLQDRRPGQRPGPVRARQRRAHRRHRQPARAEGLAPWYRAPRTRCRRPAQAWREGAEQRSGYLVGGLGRAGRRSTPARCRTRRAWAAASPPGPRRRPGGVRARLTHPRLERTARSPDKVGRARRSLRGRQGALTPGGTWVRADSRAWVREGWEHPPRCSRYWPDLGAGRCCPAVGATRSPGARCRPPGGT